MVKRCWLWTPETDTEGCFAVCYRCSKLALGRRQTHQRFGFRSARFCKLPQLPHLWRPHQLLWVDDVSGLFWVVSPLRNVGFSQVVKECPPTLPIPLRVSSVLHMDEKWVTYHLASDVNPRPPMPGARRKVPCPSCHSHRVKVIPKAGKCRDAAVQIWAFLRLRRKYWNWSSKSD